MKPDRMAGLKVYLCILNTNPPKGDTEEKAM